jgi:membrane protease YdiL (CAAX protease family)
MKDAYSAFRRRPLLFATIVTAGFLALIAAGNLLGGDRDDARGTAVEGLARVVVALAACGVAAAAGWAELGFSAPRGSRPWTMLVLPLAYLGLVYPFLFTGSIAPSTKDLLLTGLVAAGSFGAGFAEELVFRGLVFFVLLAAWERSPGGVRRAAVVSSIFFSLPHVLNALAGHQLLRVGAQVLWAFLLGVALAHLVRAAESVWPVAVLHGVLDAVVATNRMGKTIVLSPVKAAVMVLASVPVLLYALAIARRAPRMSPTDENVSGVAS